MRVLIRNRAQRVRLSELDVGYVVRYFART
jgi:hypothetical protein